VADRVLDETHRRDRLGRAREPPQRGLGLLTPAPYGGGVFIADTSAWARARRGDVAEWSRALAGGQIATCPIVDLELLHWAQDGVELDDLAARLAELRDIPITRSVTNAAQQAQRSLAHVHPLFQRSVKLPDLLIAAAAQDAAVGVLHYDRDFDTLATVLAFESRWIAPPGPAS
jgi:predicted nucleic acid-binding protein